MDLKSLIRHARGDEPADLLLRNARVVNVLSGEVDETSVALAGEFIVGLGDRPCRAEIDLHGAFVAPGFIDAHVHIESALVPPSEFARAVVPRGTTTVVTDPHEIANVLGLEGIRFMFESAKFGPLNMYVMASSCVPATAMATSGAVLHGYDLFPLKSDPWVLGLAEVMNYHGVIGGDDAVLEKIGAFQDRVIDGHGPGLSGVALQAYVAAGVQSDHESTTAEEALEKVRLGMMVMIREGTVARDLAAIVPIVTPANQHRFCFCTDDCQPADLLDRGGIDHAIRRAIALGMDPVIGHPAGDLESGAALPAPPARGRHARPARGPRGVRRPAGATAPARLPQRRAHGAGRAHGRAAQAAVADAAQHHQHRVGRAELQHSGSGHASPGDWAAA